MKFGRSSERYRKQKTAALDGRFRRSRRALERWLKFAISSPLGLIVRPPKPTSPLSLKDIRSILFFRYDALGDAVLSTPVWRTLKRLSPQIRIGVVGSPKNAELLRSDKCIDDVYVIERHDWSVEKWRELMRIRRQKWDVVVNLFFHDKTMGAIYASIAAPNAVTATLVGPRKEKYQSLYSFIGDREEAAPPIPMVLHNMRALQAAVNITASAEDLLPHLDERNEAASAVQDEIKEEMRTAGTSGYLLINTDASQSYREWGFENTLKLSLALREKWPMLHVFWTSAPERLGIARAFLDSHRHEGIDLLPAPSVHHLVAAIAGSVAVVSPDTSVIHIAAAFQKPLVGLYVLQNEFLPYGTLSEVILAPDGSSATSIEVQDVLNALIRVMAAREAVGEITLPGSRTAKV